MREDTAELASYILSDKKDSRENTFLRRARSTSASGVRHSTEQASPDAGSARPAETIAEVSEPPSPDESEEPAAEGPSMLTTMLKRSPPDKSYFYTQKEGPDHRDDGSDVESDGEDQATLTRVSTAEHRPLLAHRDTTGDPSEISPLLAARSRESQRGDYGVNHANGHPVDLEGQKLRGRRKWFGRTTDSLRNTKGRVASILPIVGNPKRWDRHLLWQNAVVAPVACLPAVVVGLLLNILDALSYGESRWASDI